MCRYRSYLSIVHYCVNITCTALLMSRVPSHVVTWPSVSSRELDTSILVPCPAGARLRSGALEICWASLASTQTQDKDENSSSANLMFCRIKSLKASTVTQFMFGLLSFWILVPQMRNLYKQNCRHWKSKISS